MCQICTKMMRNKLIRNTRHHKIKLTRSTIEIIMIFLNTLQAGFE